MLQQPAPVGRDRAATNAAQQRRLRARRCGSAADRSALAAVARSSPSAGSSSTSSTGSAARRHTTCTGSGSPSHSTAVRRMSCRSITACSAPRKRVQPLAAVEAEQAGQQVGIALALHQVMEQDAFLQRRQRIDVLHVGRAARHRAPRCASISSWLKLHQRQHLRRDALRSPAGIRLGGTSTSPLSPPSGLRQLRQRGRGEQRAHVGVQPRAAHALDQAHRQQRMPAQLEEVVVPADPLDAQQLGPDAGQRRLRPRLAALRSACRA